MCSIIPFTDCLIVKVSVIQEDWKNDFTNNEKAERTANGTEPKKGVSFQIINNTIFYFEHPGRFLVRLALTVAFEKYAANSATLILEILA
jgi:hypothetical protein